MLESILQNLVGSVDGAQAAIFLDGEGESIAHAGKASKDIKLLGAWKEIHLDQIKSMSQRLGLGDVQAVLFSLEEGNELLAPVSGEYCLLLFMSSYSDLQDAMVKLKLAIKQLRQDIE